MTEPRSGLTARDAPAAGRKGLSIRWKLFLVTSGLLAIVTIAYGWAAYHEMRASAMVAIAARLDGLASQWARMFGAGFQQESVALQRAAGDAGVRQFAVRRDEPSRAAAERTLQQLYVAGQSNGRVQLAGPDGHELLGIGEPALGSAVGDTAMFDAAARARRPVVGRLHDVGDSLSLTVASPVLAGDLVRGYVVLWRRLRLSPSPDELNRLFGGGSTRVRVANRSGDVWTDLGRRIPSRSVDLTSAGGLLTYTAPDGETLVAVARPIGDSPLMVVIESAEREVVAEAERLLRRLSLIAIVALALGALAAVALSVSLTRPLARLTRATDFVAAGDYTQHTTLATRGDEIGRLAQAFDTMVERVQQAFAARGMSEERYRRLFEAMPLPMWVYDLETLRILAVNDAAVAHYGYTPEEFVSKRITELRPPEDVPRLLAEVEGLGERLRRSGNWRHVKKDGTVIDVETSGHSMSFDGRKARIVVINDVTAQRRIELQLRQAQKMDAVGQLAGGIAHDFNNLLTVIISYSNLLLSELSDGDPRRGDVEEIRRSGESAATLTRQLLAFSRQQVVQPRVVRLNDLIASTGSMLRRLIGENIELAVALPPDAGAVRADAGQLEQVVVNLAVNARDAMPHGGRLLIETKNVEFFEGAPGEETLYPPGCFVMLAVSDNGVGMDKPTQARIFEPFFTTKEPGRGTGLGLATVYGIVNQNGGFISVYSEPGRGTSFKVYFPRVDDATVIPPPAAAGEPQGGAESILVVEDDAAVRTLVRQALGRLGYRVLEAPDGESALAFATKYPGPIHLLLTDLIMPRMSGRLLAERFVQRRPDVAVLYVSGYTDDALVHHGVLEAGMHYLEKPFTPDALARKVREVLDASGTISSSA